MKLNLEEKERYLSILKKQYEKDKSLLESEDLYLLKDEEYRKKFIEELEKLKEKIDIIENTDGELEVSLNTNFCNNDNSFMLCTLMLLLCSGFNNNSTEEKLDIDNDLTVN